MNILFVSTQFPNCSEPNRGVFSLQIVRELAALGNVRVIAPVPSIAPFNFIDSLKRYKTDHEIPEVETLGGVKVHHPKYHAPPGMGFIHPLGMYRSLKPMLERMHQGWHIDAVNCHWIFPDGVAVQKICAELKIPILLTSLGSDLNLFSRYLLRKGAIRKALIESDMVSVLSTPMLKLCLSLGVGDDSIVLIPNGVDTGKFSIRERALCREQLDLPQKARIILFVGALVPVKGVPSLLKAFARLGKSRGRGAVKLYLVGGGYLEGDLKRLAGELEITEDVVFTGPVLHDLLPVWMNAADCLCLPSLNEGHPNVVMEALACGVPVVASTVGSIPDVITAENGHLTAPDDEAQLCQKLNLCLSAPFRRETIRAAVEQMTWENCAMRYYQVLSDLGAGKVKNRQRMTR